MRRQAEDGYALLATLWLLLLAAGVAALLLERAVTAADDVKAARAQLESDLQMLSAVESVIADQALRGRRSAWSRPPASGPITIAGETLEVSVYPLIANHDAPSAAQAPSANVIDTCTDLRALADTSRSSTNPFSSASASSGTSSQIIFVRGRAGQGLIAKVAAPRGDVIYTDWWPLAC